MGKKDLPNPIFISEADGSAYIYETLNMAVRPVVSESIDLTSESVGIEAKRGRPAGKRLVCDIAAIHEGATKNYTEYPIVSLEESIPTWTAPFNKPVVTNHGRAEGLFGRGYPVEDILGRIMKVTSGDHAGKRCLMFQTVINDPDAIERVRDGRYSTVSIGARIKSAKCSICDTDWAKGDYCDHRRGKFYAEDEDDPKSAVKLCTWIIGGMEGIEISFVTMPADENAGVVSASVQGATKADKNGATESEIHLFLVDENGIEECLESGDLITVGESAHATRLLSLIESVCVNIEEVTKEDDSVATEDTTPVEPTQDETPKVEPVAEEAPEAPADQVVSEEDGSGEEPEASAEAAPVEIAAEDGTEDPEAAGDEEEPAADEDPEGKDEPKEEESEDVANKFEETCAKYRNTLVTLYVERGLSNGSLTGEAEDLANEVAEKSIEDLEALINENNETSKVSPEDILSVEGITAEGDEAPLATRKDAEANADGTFEDVISSTEKAAGVVIEGDEGEKVIIRAKARR